MRKFTKSLWLRRVSPLSLAGALVFPLALHSAEASPGMTSNQIKVAEASKKIKENYLADIEKRRRQAMLDAGSGKYAEALRELEACVQELKKTTGELAAEQLETVQDNIKRLKKVWCSETMREARKLAGSKKYTEAAAKAHSALSLTDDNDYIISFINECKTRTKGEEFRSSTAMKNVAPDYKDNRKKVDFTLREAKVLFRNKRYEAASKRLEDVLRIDPFNIEAIDMLALTYNRLYKVGEERSLETIKHYNSRNVWEWAEPLPTVSKESSTSVSGTVRDNRYVDLQTRMEKIYFPAFKFTNTPLSKVIEYLNDKSRSFDPEKKGVTIIDRLPPEGKRLLINMDLGKMPLSDILRYLSMDTGYVYTISKGNVNFGQVDNMEPNSFPINGAIIAGIVDALTVKPTESGMKDIEGGGGGDNAPEDEEAPTIEASAEAGAEAGEAAAETDEEVEKRNAALKSYFVERGIPFDNGAQIYYNEVEELLEVRNTPENLRRIGELLRQLNALKQPMVMVEVKMIELTDTNLNELGFEWMFSTSGTSKHWNLGTNSPLRNGDSAKLIKELKIFPNFGEKLFGKDMNVKLDLSVNAVAQNRSAEVLASPRILTENAPKKPAMIKMIERTYFITKWEQPDIETDGLNISMDGTDPEWDDEGKEIGVTFTVQPVVQADNYTILLKNIHPVFLTHVKDHNYDIAYEVGTYRNGEMVPVQSQKFNLRMPEFSNREMTTTISLYDGETVLIGGMVDNETSERNDKWPILSEIPLLGRLFQEKKSNVTNRTMLIFITGRLVNPDGSPVREPRDNSVINFNR